MGLGAERTPSRSLPRTNEDMPESTDRQFRAWWKVEHTSLSSRDSQGCGKAGSWAVSTHHPAHTQSVACTVVVLGDGAFGGGEGWVRVVPTMGLVPSREDRNARAGCPPLWGSEEAATRREARLFESPAVLTSAGIQEITSHFS